MYSVSIATMQGCYNSVLQSCLPLNPPFPVGVLVESVPPKVGEGERGSGGECGGGSGVMFVTQAAATPYIHTTHTHIKF